MKLSARNQFHGKITHVQPGAVNAMVTLGFNGGSITGTISMAAVDELELAVGKEAAAIVKATEVMIGVGDMKISARNQFKGTITKINEGAVNAIVALKLSDGNMLSATISMSSVKELELAVGKEATAVIKATSVMFGVE